MRIFVDLEATEAGEVIAIGAVTDNNQRFFAVMAPNYSRITPRITAITGITEEAAEQFPPAEVTIHRFVEWARERDTGIGIHFFTFGKNDGGFIQTTRNFYAAQWGANQMVMELDWIRANMSNGAAPIYNAFRKPLISLRSAYFTYKNQILGNDAHNPLQDAVWFKELVCAAEEGWTLPEGAELVKVAKPVLPKKDAVGGMNMPDELNRKVVAYWYNPRSGDKSAVFDNLITAAKALCTQAIQTDKLDAVQAAYRVLNSAIEGSSYCGRKFFLVD